MLARRPRIVERILHTQVRLMLGQGNQNIEIIAVALEVEIARQQLAQAFLIAQVHHVAVGERAYLAKQHVAQGFATLIGHGSCGDVGYRVAAFVLQVI